jgi:peptidyl-prolyl cis-trans isomerase SurA
MKEQLPKHRISRHPYTTALYVCIFITLSCVAGTAKVVDRVVAVVNDEVITLSELEKEVETISMAIQTDSKAAMPDRDMLMARTLDEIIDQRLIEQKSREFNISVSSDEIDRAYEARRRRMGLEPDEFRKEMVKSGLTEEIFRQKLRANILQNKVISLDVHSKVVITDEMIQQYYEKEYTTNVDEGNYYLLQMGFKWKDSDQEAVLKENRAAALKRAEKIRALAAGGENFKDLAKKHSELPSAVDGGDLGVFSLDEMASWMRKAVENLQPGEVSDIIETTAGYQFFRLAETSQADTPQTVPLESVKDEIRKKISEQKMQEIFSEWVKNLKDQAYIQKL